jgi:hypothetical protein
MYNIIGKYFRSRDPSEIYSQSPLMVHPLMVQSRLWYTIRLDGPTFLDFTYKTPAYGTFTFVHNFSFHLC